VALNANALTDVATAKAWLRRTHATGTASTDDTAIVELLINGVSNAIAKHTGREFVSEGAGSSDKTFRYDGDGFLNLAPYEARSISAVTVGGVALVAGDGAGSGDYLSMPRNKTTEGTYTYLSVRAYLKPYPTNSLYAIVLNERDAVVTGVWGCATVPADVVLACLIAVADLYRNPEQVQTRGSGEFQISELQDNPGSAESLPLGARRLLEPFIRPAVV
jgi:hypothetical protein